MHLIEVTPVPCIVCGRGNANDRNEPLRFVDFERDINWNDPTIMCEDCVAQAGGLVGMMSLDERATLRLDVERGVVALHEANAEIDSLKRRAKRIGLEFASTDA